MRTQTFACRQCDIRFDIRIKLNRHNAKHHNTETNFLRPGVFLTDDEKERYFDKLRDSYLEVRDKVQSYKQRLETLGQRKGYKKIHRSNPKEQKTSDQDMETIEVDETIPPGWKSGYKKVSHQFFKNGGKADSKCKIYQDPGGRFHMSRRQALRHMTRNKGFSQEEVNIMRAGMEADGWKYDKYLPSGWMVMDGSERKFCSYDYEPFRNTKLLLKHIIVENIV